MRKLLALTLAVILTMSLGVPAFADDGETTGNPGGTETGIEDKEDSYISVYGSYQEYSYSEDIVSVDVSWDSMNFTYAASQQGKWNVKTHKYENATDDAAWLKDKSQITVKNHSNCAVTAELSYAETVTTVHGTFNGESTATMELETAAKEEYMGDNWQQAPTDTTTFQVTGYMSQGDDGKLGTITVAITAIPNDHDPYADALSLEGKALSEWPELISAYLDEHPGELTIKLGMDGIDYVGDTYGQVDSANMPAHVLNSAVYNYNDKSYDNKVALTLVDVQSIGDKAFIYAASAFSSISAPNATSIGSQAFQGNHATTEYYFPKVTSIGANAFKYNSAMTSITFGKVITNLRDNSFGTGEDSTLLGNDCHTENVTITLNAKQNDYIATTFGENGTFKNNTFKNVVKAGS